MNSFFLVILFVFDVYMAFVVCSIKFVKLADFHWMAILLLRIQPIQELFALQITLIYKARPF